MWSPSHNHLCLSLWFSEPCGLLCLSESCDCNLHPLSWVKTISASLSLSLNLLVVWSPKATMQPLTLAHSRSKPFVFLKSNFRSKPHIWQHFSLRLIGNFLLIGNCSVFVFWLFFLFASILHLWFVVDFKYFLLWTQLFYIEALSSFVVTLVVLFLSLRMYSRYDIHTSVLVGSYNLTFYDLAIPLPVIRKYLGRIFRSYLWFCMLQSCYPFPILVKTLILTTYVHILVPLLSSFPF